MTDQENIANRPLADGVWCGIEAHLKMGTVDQADGRTEIYIDGELMTNHPHKFRDFASGHANVAWTYVNICRQNDANMYRLEDDYILATTRVGCSGAPPPGDTQAPIPPTGLAVQ